MGDVDHTIELHEQMNAPRPDPPKEYAKRFKPTTYDAFYGYLEARPYALWLIPDLRLLAQVALLEDAVLACFDQVIDGGPVGQGSQGQDVVSPAMTALGKAQAAQGTIMRRLGIGIDGLIRANTTAITARQQELNRKADEANIMDPALIAAGKDSGARGLMA